MELISESQGTEEVAPELTQISKFQQYDRKVMHKHLKYETNKINPAKQ